MEDSISKRLDDMNTKMDTRFSCIEKQLSGIDSTLNHPENGVCKKQNALSTRVEELEKSDAKQETKLGMISAGISTFLSLAVTLILNFIKGSG